MYILFKKKSEMLLQCSILYTMTKKYTKHLQYVNLILYVCVCTYSTYHHYTAIKKYFNFKDKDNSS
jgi:hypothetical protein